MSILYKFSDYAFHPVFFDGAYCPLIAQTFASTREGNESKHVALPQEYDAYFKRLNPLPKQYRKFISKTWGPTRGKNKKGYVIFNLNVYPGPDNYVRIKGEVTGLDGKRWGLLECMPLDKIPDMNITHESDPWFIHKVYGSNRKGTASAVTNAPYVPIIGNIRWIPMRWLVQA